MGTKLENLLESIDPSKTLDETSARVDKAINTFPMPQAIVEDWYEFQCILAKFCRHVDICILRIGSDFPVYREIYESKCSDLLDKAFGARGQQVAFEMARTGNEGGLYKILTTIANLLGRQYADNEIGARISHYWNDLSVNEQLAAPDEYLEKFGHLLPSEITEGYAVRIRVNFPKVLEEHVKMIHNMRRIGR